MIRSQELKKEIVRLIHENTEWKAISNEATEDLPKNFFFIRFLSGQRESLNNDQDLRTYTVEIQFREEDNNKLAMIGDQLTDLFYYAMKFEDRVILVTYNEWEIKERRDLFFRFVLEFSTAKDKKRENRETMTNLVMDYERS